MLTLSYSDLKLHSGLVIAPLILLFWQFLYEAATAALHVIYAKWQRRLDRSPLDSCGPSLSKVTCVFFET